MERAAGDEAAGGQAPETARERVTEPGEGGLPGWVPWTDAEFPGRSVMDAEAWRAQRRTER
jgi:hypothetical protein